MDRRLLPSGEYEGMRIQDKRKGPYFVIAVVAGAVLVLGATVHPTNLLANSAVRVTRPVMASTQHLHAIPEGMAFQGFQGEPEANLFEEATSAAASGASGSFTLQQGGFATLIGMVLGALGALIHSQLTKQPAWSIAAMDEEEGDALPTKDDLVAAREEYFRRSGKGKSDAPVRGFSDRKFAFPGEAVPVDLVEMYKRFEELLGENVHAAPAVGTRVKGTIFDIDDKGISVDYGGKTIGYCPLEEMALCKIKEASELVRIGEVRKFDIMASTVNRKKADEEATLLSMKTIQEEIAWQRLQQYRENDIPFRVILKSKNRGGYTVEVDDLAVPGFLPKSQATSDLATAPDTAEPATFMDQVVDVKVLDLDAERRRLVVSQRAANPKMAADTFKVGTVHEGVVQNVKPYGVFIDVNGVSGLLHISQISHNRIDNVDSIFKVGDKIKCMVLSQDQVQGRLALSTKRLEPTHGDMLTNPQLVYEKAEEMAERFREDIAAAERRMQEFEAKLAEQNTVAF